MSRVLRAGPLNFLSAAAACPKRQPAPGGCRDRFSLLGFSDGVERHRMSILGMSLLDELRKSTDLRYHVILGDMREKQMHPAPHSARWVLTNAALGLYLEIGPAICAMTSEGKHAVFLAYCSDAVICHDADTVVGLHSITAAFNVTALMMHGSCMRASTTIFVGHYHIAENRPEP
ncbi:hypothetical protein FB451DRAFT_1374013 [Mycena latifolia]|nr:hypothetical protein FB451DRAFT_1374013 [Mycena latifolia]